MFSYTMNEYLHINEVTKTNFNVWVIDYEPLEHLPIVKGTVQGTVFDGEFPVINFYFTSDGISNADGLIVYDTGVITLRFHHPPSDEHYLSVSYESGFVVEKNWLFKGF